MSLKKLLLCATFLCSITNQCISSGFSEEIETSDTKASAVREGRASCPSMSMVISGFPEFSPKAQIVFEQVKRVIADAFSRYGYSPLETSTFERVETIQAKGMVDKEIYALRRLQAEEGEGDKDLALRFDLTVPLARYVAEHSNKLTFPFRRQAVGKVYRGEKASTGRYREFYQFDADIIGRGTLDIIHDAEPPAMIHEIFDSLGIGEFVIRLNNRKILQGMFGSLGIEDPKKIKKAIRVVDSLEKVSRGETVSQLIELGIAPEKVDELIDILTTTAPNNAILERLDLMAASMEAGFKEGTDQLKAVYDATLALGVPERRLRIDLGIARGLDYYTGTVYETNLLAAPDLGSICSGGRYDELISKYAEARESFPGVGISIGLTRLLSNLFERGILRAETQSPAKVLVTTQDRALLSSYQAIAATLRRAGINTEIYYEDSRLGKQITSASKKGIPFVLIGNNSELSSGNINVKNLLTGIQETIPVDVLAEYLRAH